MRVMVDSSPQLLGLIAERLKEWGISIGSVSPSGARQKVREGEEEVIFSLQLQLVRMLHELVRQLPEVDEERVKEVVQQVESGNYHPDSRAVAEAIINEIFVGKGKGRGQG